jgi:16S rRNA (cytidine1402-2'-O)-methyltransferase
MSVGAGRGGRGDDSQVGNDMRHDDVESVSDKSVASLEQVAQAEPVKVEGGSLYVVATPIGNLQDISLRALAVLAAADIVAAEDTRNTSRLLDRHRIQARTLSLHEHNEARRADEIVGLLGEGKAIAYVTDAGTPGLSDPGAILVARVREAGFRVVPIPGASAAVSALSVAGLVGTAFRFAGFLPERGSARRKAIAALALEDCTLVFYEAPHRVVDSVADLASELGPERDIVIARELTKLFESVHRCKLGEAVEWLRGDSDRQRGEFVLVVSGNPAPREAGAGIDADKVLKLLLAELPLAQAVKLACAITGKKRGELYPRALELKDGTG